MKDGVLKLKAYKPVNNKLQHFWEFDVISEWGRRDQEWFIHALKASMNELDADQKFIRAEFKSTTKRNSLKQGDLLCIGNKQCYIIY